MTNGSGRVAKTRGGRRGGGGGASQHSCFTCGVSYTNRHNLERHVRERHSGQSHVCERCGATFSRRHRLEAHVVKHVANGVPERFQCTLCPATASTRAELARHVQCHTVEEGGGTACPDCGIVFKHYWLMKLHRKRHLTARHSCPICHRLFRYPNKVADHLRTHGKLAFCATAAQNTKKAVLAALGQASTSDRRVLLQSVASQSEGVEDGSHRRTGPIVLEGGAGVALNHPAGMECPTLQTTSCRQLLGLGGCREKDGENTTTDDMQTISSEYCVAGDHSDAAKHDFVPDVSAQPEFDELTSSDVQDFVVSCVRDTEQKLGPLSDFSDENRPLTLEDAVRQLTAGSPEDPEMQVEIVPELVTDDAADVIAFETDSSPVQDLHAGLVDVQELGFELEVDSVEDEHMTPSSFQHLQQLDDQRADEVQLELDIRDDSVTKDLRLSSNTDDNGSPSVCVELGTEASGAGLVADCLAEDLELELDAAELEGEIGVGLAQLMAQGVRVEVEESERVGETVMVITLADE